MSVSPRRFRSIVIAALVIQAVIVMTGVTVRLTGSGLGCYDWPRCSTDQIVDFSEPHAFIEQGNRIFSAVVGLGVALAAVWGARRRRPYRRDLELLSWGLVAGVVGQIPLGGITVLTGLHPLAVQSHFLLSMLLVANATVLLHRASSAERLVDRNRTTAHGVGSSVSADTGGTPRSSHDDPTSATEESRIGDHQPVAAGEPATGPFVGHRRLIVAMVGIVLLAGTVVTGTGPHAGDEDVDRLDIPLNQAARAHGALVIATLGLALLLAWRLRGPHQDRRVMNLLSTWVFLGLLQGAVGYVQYLNELPELLVGSHIALAVVLWIVTISLLEVAPAAECRPPGTSGDDQDGAGHSSAFSAEIHASRTSSMSGNGELDATGEPVTSPSPPM